MSSSSKNSVIDLLTPRSCFLLVSKGLVSRKNTVSEKEHKRKGGWSVERIQGSSLDRGLLGLL